VSLNVARSSYVVNRIVDCAQARAELSGGFRSGYFQTFPVLVARARRWTDRVDGPERNRNILVPLPFRFDYDCFALLGSVMADFRDVGKGGLLGWDDRSGLERVTRFAGAVP
jgi:hypothetical protein